MEIKCPIYLYIKQSDVFNKTITPKLAGQRDEVIKLLQEASGYSKSGRNEMALKTYDNVLRLDPYNSAARKGMEAVHNSKIKYDDEAYNETRGRLLWQVEKSWERPPRKDKQGRSTESAGSKLVVRNTRDNMDVIKKASSRIPPRKVSISS